MTSSFSLVEKNSEQMQKFESELEKGMNVTIRMLEDLKLTSDGSGDVSEFTDRKVKELKTMLQQFIQMDAESKAYLQAVEQVKSEVNRNRDTPMKLEPCLQQALQQQTQNMTINYERHPKYKEFMALANELLHPEPVQATQNVVATDDEDSELILTAETVNTIDPITRQEIAVPVRNRKCRHLYDLNSMMAHIKQRKGKARCPIPGCVNPNFVSSDDLEPDREMQNYINKNRKRN